MKQEIEKEKQKKEILNNCVLTVLFSKRNRNFFGYSETTPKNREKNSEIGNKISFEEITKEEID